jgi:dCTP deaminase
MSILPDFTIEQLQETDNIIEPFDESNVQPASYDLTLSDTVVELSGRRNHAATYDITEGVPDGEYRERDTDEYVLSSGDFVLASTEETVYVPDGFAAQVKGRSSIGRLGVVPHTAGWIDPGFEGDITLELVNHSPVNWRLESGVQIAQIVYSTMLHPSNEVYGEKSNSKYQGQSGVTASRIENDNRNA